PIALLGRNIGQAFYGEIAAIGRKDPERIRALTVELVRRLFLLSIIPAAVLFIAGPQLFVLIFGSEWEFAGRIASASAPYVLATFVSLPVVHVLNVVGHQSYYLRINVLRAVWTVG